ncbi:MAG TPA: CoA transferase [Micropepsaceae bacterium]|nr:CoA transferase [Micropepsaceae bacterium]
MFDLLNGVRILDLTTTYLGPYATQFLGDMGADIVKVEPRDGEVGRSPRPSRSPEMGAGFLNTNRNKRSLAIDLRSDAGRDVVLRLAKQSDAFVHNMRPQAAARLGLSHDELRRANPAIVYCLAPGFDQAGPMAAQPAYDDIIQALSGLSYLNRDDSGAPRFLPTIVCDKVVGVHLAFAIAVGLAHRFRTGEGCAIEVPMFETMVAFLLVEHLAGHTFRPPLASLGYERMMAANRRPYRTGDGYMAIMPYTTQQWTRFLEAVGRTDLLTEHWVRDPVQRSANVDRLYQVIAGAAPSRTNAEWMVVLKAADVPCGPVNTFEDLLSHPQLSAVSLFQPVEHPGEGPITSVRSPFRVADNESQPDRPAPSVGEGGRDILRAAGFTQDEIENLISNNVLAPGPET